MYLARTGKTQAECCREMGLSQNTNSRFMTGKFHAGSSAYAKWNQYFNNVAGVEAAAAAKDRSQTQVQVQADIDELAAVDVSGEF